MAWSADIFEAFQENKHKLAMFVGTTDLRLILCDVASDLTADALYADISATDELADGNGYTAGGYTVTVAYDETDGVYTVTVDGNITVTASGGSIGPFTWAVLYDSAATGDPLICRFTRAEGADTVTNGNSKVLLLDTIVVYQSNPPA